MTKVKMICFDMDGTIADLYGVNCWLEMLREENARPYEIAKPMWNMNELNEVLRKLQKQGVEIRVITWLSMNSSEDYKEKTRQAKLQWLENQGFPFNKFHGVAYGTTKANSIRQYLDLGEQAILIDDNAKVRQGWNWGETIDPTTQNIIEMLKALIQSRLLVYKKNKKILKKLLTNGSDYVIINTERKRGSPNENRICSSIIATKRTRDKR